MDPKEYNRTMSSPEVSYDFDNLINSPNGVDVISKLLEGERRRMNTMSLTEFYRYERLFQYNGIELIGENQFRQLATEYFSKISIYDPVRVMDGDKVAFTLPAIFNRYTGIDTAGQTGIDINQAFINACNSDDPMVHERLRKYSDFYRRLINVVNNEKVQNENIEISQKQASDVMKKVGVKAAPVEQNNPEVESIKQSNFKDTDIVSLSDNRQNVNEGEDEFEPL